MKRVRKIDIQDIGLFCLIIDVSLYLTFSPNLKILKEFTPPTYELELEFLSLINYHRKFGRFHFINYLKIKFGYKYIIISGTN